ncbi:MAG: hypothetical protein ACPG1C_12895 [Alphaproteobacteria bacterium]
MKIAPATDEDIPQMVALIEARREILAAAEPVFWARGENTVGLTQAFFGYLIQSEETIALCAYEGTTMQGFLIALKQAVPPAYTPPGDTYLIDDFALADEALWPSVGVALMQAAETVAKANGAGQLIAVSAMVEQTRSKTYKADGFNPVSQWWHKPL